VLILNTYMLLSECLLQEKQAWAVFVTVKTSERRLCSTAN